MDLHRIGLAPGSAGWLRFSFPGKAAGASEPAALLSLRSAGDMGFDRAGPGPGRERLLRGLGLEAGAVLGLELTHSRRVLFPAGPIEQGSLLDLAAAGGGADGLILGRDSGLFASVTVADCMPIWILDRSTGAYGVLHSGWRGTGILEEAVGLLGRRGGSGPGAISAILGPAIGSCCYAVPRERARAFAAEFGPESVAEGPGGPRLDLRSANLSIARRLGLGSLLSIEACTCCEPGLGSFRREGPASFTRMLALAGHLPGEAAA